MDVMCGNGTLFFEMTSVFVRCCAAIRGKIELALYNQ